MWHMGHKQLMEQANCVQLGAALESSSHATTPRPPRLSRQGVPLGCPRRSLLNCQPITGVSAAALESWRLGTRGGPGSTRSKSLRQAATQANTEHPLGASRPRRRPPPPSEGPAGSSAPRRPPGPSESYLPGQKGARAGSKGGADAKRAYPSSRAWRPDLHLATEGV